MRCVEVDVRHCGKFKVYVQGEGRVGKTGFLTVHDVGSNHNKFIPFVATPSMLEVSKKTVWIHVCLPGQDDNDADLDESYQFPTLDQIAEDLLSIMEQHHVPSVIGFGEGAGANILCRFCLMYPHKCIGLILLNCTAGAANFEERLQRTLINAKGGGKKFMGKLKGFMGKQAAIQSSKESSTKESAGTNAINPNNVLKYLDAYIKRTDISQRITSELHNIVLITGEQSKHLNSVRAMNTTNVNRMLLVILDNVIDALMDSPLEVARALIFFCKGCGILTGVPLLGLEREFAQSKGKHPPTEAQLQMSRKIQMYENMSNEDV